MNTANYSKGILVLEDGTFFEGTPFGAPVTSSGEIVFITSMTGYQEMLTDPSFAGQIVVPTYPLIGNYGINTEDIESRKIQVRGFVVREYCPAPSHWQNTRTLDDYLKASNIPGLSGIDTRCLTRHLRSRGVMMGIMSAQLTVAESLKALKQMPAYGATDFVKVVTTPDKYSWTEEEKGQGSYHIVIVDMGLRYNIARILSRLGCSLTIVPCSASAEEILSLKPHGVVLSPGPGDPALLGYMIDTIKGLLEKVPIMGICLGHQLIGKAFGAETFKLKFGHRGGNHPVRDIETGRIHITTQNHGYAAASDMLKGGLEVSHINLNDNTVEGFRHKELPIISIQYHSEGSPGPQDNIYIFERFLDIIRKRENN
ncbi:MAG: glutamine-hydrolyzing carbamoyl-phosphate synthase small subunit [Dehalococcoidia bacterium]|nr:glutamine-hydrolyzing carbamoyl-phosphate synthase small subunit [Dehalococcoidia bacterium]